jgi:hypothetical protein
MKKALVGQMLQHEFCQVSSGYLRYEMAGLHVLSALIFPGPPAVGQFWGGEQQSICKWLSRINLSLSS